jgi:DNA-binding response OmpR family regulator
MPVLIIEDDPGVARFLQQALTEAGHTTDMADTGPKGLDLALRGSYSLILLDVMLPGLDGFSVCRRLRAQAISAPILMLTARDAVEDKIEGLDSGADDYIVKPFQMGELLARCRALQRRLARTGTLLTVGDLTLDPATRRAIRNGKSILLSSTEYSLLEYLMRHTGKVLSRPMILDHVWQYDFDGHDNVLDVYVSYLRAKIDRGFEEPLIHTVRGKGFVLESRVHAR